MPINADEIADRVLSKFESLPYKCKPRARSDNTREWVPLSGIVLSRTDHNGLECVALGTGMQCLPATAIPVAHGNVLHDWHAEILAIRSFNDFLLRECAQILQLGPRASAWVRKREEEDTTDEIRQPFAIKDDVSIFMYCSEAPCGDASMELVMSAQEVAAPWPVPEPSSTGVAPTLHGRGYFSELGIVRRKPSRGDAPSTLSKSCTDKLALKQCTSLLNSLTALIIAPGNAYLSTLVLPVSQHVATAITRAFGASGRFSSLTPESCERWGRTYAYRPFQVAVTSRQFAWSRRGGRPGQRMVPSNIAALYTPYVTQSLIAGVIQGRKRSDPQAASAISKRSMWRTLAGLASTLGSSEIRQAVMTRTYSELKESSILKDRNRVKNDVRESVLKGWERNTGDEDFELNEMN